MTRRQASEPRGKDCVQLSPLPTWSPLRKCSHGSSHTLGTSCSQEPKSFYHPKHTRVQPTLCLFPSLLSRKIGAVCSLTTLNPSRLPRPGLSTNRRPVTTPPTVPMSLSSPPTPWEGPRAPGLLLGHREGKGQTKRTRHGSSYQSTWALPPGRAASSPSEKVDSGYV